MSSKMVKDSFTVTIGNTIYALFTFLTFIIFARELGVEKYGIFALAFSIYIVSLLLSDLRTNEGIAKFLAQFEAEKHHGKLKGVAQDLLAFKILISCAIFIILFFSAPFLSNNIFGKSELNSLIKGFALLLIPATINKYGIAIFRGLRKFKKVTILLITESTLTLQTGYILVKFQGLIGCLYAYAISVSITTILNIYFLLSSLHTYKSIPSQPIRKEFIDFSIWPLISSIIVTTIEYSGMLFLGGLRNPNEVALYKVALSLSRELTFVIVGALSVVLMPNISAMWAKREKEAIYELFCYVTKISTLIGLLIIIPLIYLSNFTIQFFYTADYIEANQVLKILLVATYIMISSVGAGPVLLGIGKPKLITLVQIPAIPIVLILNPFLILKWGEVGAGITLLITFLVTHLLGIYILEKALTNTTKFTKTHTVIITTTTVIILLSTIITTQISIIITLPAIILLIYFLNYINSKDLIKLKNAIKTIITTT